MSEIVQYCPLCSGEHSRLFESRLFRGRVVINRICQDCGLVFQSPHMTKAELDVFYAEEYRLFQEGSIDPTLRNINAQERRARALHDFVQEIILSVSRQLDIGCSMGILLKYFQSEYRNQSVGVEPGDAHRMYACKEGLVVYSSLEDLENAGEKRFDLISMSHVLEHLPDPIGYLTHLRESILVSDGWLLLEVPNLYAHDSFEVAHLFAFSPHTLHEVLRKSGFEVVKYKKHGRPHSALLPLYLTVLCRPASRLDHLPVHPERGVGVKRRLGMLKRHILERLMPAQAWLKV